MAAILLLETSSKNCSVGLSVDDEIIAIKEESSSQFVHSEKLHVFIEEVMIKAGKRFSELDAVAIGKGPGSYTGLRIGVSAAKGFCFGLNIPLISIDSLTLLASSLFNEVKGIIIPMMDARRMEVYMSQFDSSGKALSEISARVITEESFQKELNENTLHFIGDGCEKIKNLIPHQNAVYHNVLYPSVKQMAAYANRKYQKSQFEDTAYFEPFYLKDFVAGKPKKLL